MLISASHFVVIEDVGCVPPDSQDVGTDLKVVELRSVFSDWPLHEVEAETTKYITSGYRVIKRRLNIDNKIMPKCD